MMPVRDDEEKAMPTWPCEFLIVIFCILTLISGCGKEDNGPPARGQFTPANTSVKHGVHDGLGELLDENLTFLDSSGVKWVAPKGTLTDGASVPRLLPPITDGQWDPRFLKAAVVHDAYCQKDNETRFPDQYRKKPWRA